MWYYSSVSYHMKSRNAVREVQSSFGEQLRCGILPNKHCIVLVKLVTVESAALLVKLRVQ